eukprot:2106318-Amphidinium_carterae.1
MGEEGSSFHGHQTMGTAAPACLQKRPRGQSLAAAGRDSQKKQNSYGSERIAPAGSEGKTYSTDQTTDNGCGQAAG